MFTIKKRGSGKIKTEVSSVDLYRYYRKTCKNPVEQPVFNAVIKDINLLIRDRILLESEEFKMPYRLGKLKIKKITQLLHLMPKNKWPVDYKRSKELGFIVYHEQDNTCRWKWDKRKAIVTNQTIYMFKPSRICKRMLAHCIKNLKKDYFK